MTDKNESYKQIVKSTGVFGSSQVIIILLGLIRTKFAAILLGALGLGLIGIYQSIVDIIRSISTLGVDTSGVKEIAETKANRNQEYFEKTVSIFRLWFTLTAFMGLFICVVFCFPISLWAFETPQYAMHIAALSLCVFFGVLATGRSVILQATRQIGYMAKAGIWTAFTSLVVIVPLYYVLGTKAIIPSLIFSSVALFFFSDYYFGKLRIKKVKADNQEAFKAGTNSLKLGIYILLSSILSTVAMFLIRTYIVRSDSLESAGLFQAVWAITTVYLGLLLKSMGTDFFPRLSAIANDNFKMKTLVNEQSYITSLVATPIIIALILSSHHILTLLYSTEFTDATILLRWQLLGSVFKIIAWPMAFILLAKNSGKLFIISEFIFYGAYLGTSYFLYPIYGIEALGIGYLASYVIYFVCIAIMGRIIADCSLDSQNTQIIAVSIILTTISFVALLYFNKGGILVCILTLIASCVYSAIMLNRVFSIEDLKRWLSGKE